MNLHMDVGEQKACRTCGYYRQHYIWHQGYMPVNRGHCSHPPRNRNCRPDMAACPKWIPQDEEHRENRVAPEPKTPPLF